MASELTATVATLAASAVVLYVLLGYPALLWLAARLSRRREPLTSATPPPVTVILPVRNGERWLAAKLDSILGLDYPRDLLHVVVIDDGSTDGTAAIAARYEAHGVEVLRQAPRGKAAALNAGLARATGDVLFFTDVRQRLDRHALRALVKYFADPEVGVVSGELVILDGESEEEANIGLYWRYEKWIRRHQSRLHSVPGATGSIYAMRRALARPLPAGMLVDDMYLPLAAFFQGYRILFASEARAYDLPTGLDSEFRRKVRTLAGNYQIIWHFPRLLVPTHPLWVHFLSHKIGRLLLPFSLLMVAIATPWLPLALLVPVALAQLLLYGLAACDPLVPSGATMKRVSSPARTFVVLMLAALAAVSVLIVGADGLWRDTRVRQARRREESVTTR